MKARLAVLVAGVLLVTACSSGGERVPPRAGPVDPPRPSGAQDDAAVPSPSAGPAATCNPRASLRPVGAPPAPGQLPAGSTMAAIAQRGRLVVGTDQNGYLLAFRDPRTGQLSGFDIDIARAVARALFGDPDRVQFRAITAADRVPVLQKGEVDIVVRSTTMTCERAKDVAFSTEYLTAGQRVLVPLGSTATGLDDLGGQKVCAAAGSTSIQKIAGWPSHPVPVSVVNIVDCLVLLQQHQVAAISSDDTILAGLAAQDPTTKVVGPRISDEPYGIALPLGKPDLVRYVNAVLDRIRADGTWLASYQRWFGGLGPAPAPPTPVYQD